MSTEDGAPSRSLSWAATTMAAAATTRAVRCRQSSEPRSESVTSGHAVCTTRRSASTSADVWFVLVVALGDDGSLSATGDVDADEASFVSARVHTCAHRDVSGRLLAAATDGRRNVDDDDDQRTTDDD